MTHIQNLEMLFQSQLRDMYYAEQQLLKALTEMSEKANDERLKAAFLSHRAETEDQITKLEQVFRMLDLEPKGEKCEAITGIIKEAKEMISHASKDPETLDAALIAAGQKAEHYEIATYGTLCAFAKKLGRIEEAQILHSILEQEKGADEKLSELAGDGINEAADKEAKKSSWFGGESRTH